MSKAWSRKHETTACSASFASSPRSVSKPFSFTRAYRPRLRFCCVRLATNSLAWPNRLHENPAPSSEPAGSGPRVGRKDERSLGDPSLRAFEAAGTTERRPRSFRSPARERVAQSRGALDSRAQRVEHGVDLGGLCRRDFAPAAHIYELALQRFPWATVKRNS